MGERREEASGAGRGPAEAPRAEALAEEALDPKKHEDVARAISQLTPEEAAHFVQLLEASIRRRRVQLVGYLLSLVALLGGMVLALAYYGAADRGTFVGWVFFLPFVAVALIFFVFGRWAARIR
jgi:hypothetical protein